MILREVFAQMLQLCHYIEDAAAVPSTVDLGVLKTKATQVKRMIEELDKR